MAIHLTSNKYHSKKVIVNGITFDSKKEAQRWHELRILEIAGEITGLDRQVKFLLIPSQRDKNGKLLEREVSYYADFVYTDNRNGKRIVEDTKGVRTAEYIIKRKLMLYIHGIRITEK